MGLRVDADIVLKILPVRRVALAFKKKLNLKMVSRETLGVIVKMDEPEETF